MSAFFKQTKTIESMMHLLLMAKAVFKPEKLTLFFIDLDMQNFVFGKKKSTSNFNRIQVGDSNIIAMSISDEDMYEPLFKTIEEAGCYMMNNKAMVIPIKEHRKLYMTLQVIHKVNMKINN